MPVNATLSTPGSISGTTTTASSVAASTDSGTPVPQITRMAVEGIRGADGDMTWAGEWSSSTSYVVNQVVQYNGSAYVCILGNSNMSPSSNTSQWTLMVSKGDIGTTGATGSAGDAGVTGPAGSTGPTGQKGETGSTGATGPQGAAGADGQDGQSITGPAGPSGADGSAGQKGDTGSTGATGPQGPAGSQGDSGQGATVTIGTVTTGVVGSDATVTNAGTNRDAILNISLPTGADGANGATGATGSQGSTGTAATIAVGSTTTGNVGTNASVSNSGTSSAATFNFTIPRGDKGDTGVNGAAGAAATIAVGTVTTSLPGTNASISNTGSSSAASFDFTIPRGATGATGEITWKGGWSNSTAYGTNEAVYYNGSSYIAIVNNQNVTPGSDNTKWNIMAQAGAEGGAISSMSDTDISASIADNSIIMYHNSSTKWKDVQPFGSVHGNIALDGGSF